MTHFSLGDFTSGATLPGGWTTAVVKHCDHLHAILPEPVEHTIREALHRGTAYSCVNFRVEFWVIGDQIESRSYSAHEILTESWRASLVPLGGPSRSASASAVRATAKLIG